MIPNLSPGAGFVCGRGEAWISRRKTTKKGGFRASEGGFPLPRKQACRGEFDAAVLRDGSSHAQGPS